MDPVGIQAYAALVLWIPICMALFGSMKPHKAAFVAVIVGIVILPEKAVFDAPALPPFDKQVIACLASFIGATLFLRAKIRRAKFLGGAELFFVVIVIGNIGTALTNPDPVLVGGGLGLDGVTPTEKIVLQGLTTYEIPSLTIRDALGILLPFHLGRALVRDRDDAVLFWTVVVGTMLAMLLPMLLELRISPQLHRWIYGAHPSDFGHNMRDGGFKSTLFFVSGLALAMFLLAAIYGCAILKRVRVPVMGFPARSVMFALWGALLLSRNVAANIYAVAIVPLALRRDTSSAARLALLLTLLVVTYPWLRGSQTFPARELVDFSAKYNEGRAQSLAFRFDNEDILLERANERKWFGWGGYGRSRLYNEQGRDISIADGEWIIRYGDRGIVGFVGSFGLLVWPVLVAYRRRKRIKDPESLALVDSMSLLAAICTVDLLPNGLFTVLPYVFAGALAGVTEGATKPVQARQP